MLLFAPHCDDAALSCAALLDRGEAVDVLTVFGGRPDPPRQAYWDERCGFADSDEAVRVRQEEELEALALGGHRVGFLDLLEEQYLDGDRSPADAAPIAEAVAGWGGGLVAAPIGAGRGSGLLDRLRARHGVPPHPDHLFVRDAVLAAAEGPVLLYEEFPYLRSGGAESEAARLGAEPLSFPVDRSAKARRIAAYTSQLPFIGSSDERLDDPAVLPETERYWLLRSPGRG
jgi:GlcNAc-PI de-N-acetylase